VIALGTLDLFEVIGKGGMGVVWRGIHRPTKQPVAVKFLTSEGVNQPWYVEAFRAEVRAVARLHHPSIITVFDHGLVTEDVAQASQGQLVAGCPYLVMEYMAGGSLLERCGLLRWPSIQQVLVNLLDGLAHAHARGVIHRDIKPENVLVTRDLKTIKLTDFSIAHAIAAPSETDQEAIMGTPSYMAPEQFGVHWRDYGPWTDLYSLGCFSYALLTGHPPFAHITNPNELIRAHLTQEVPPIETIIAVPKAFEKWIERLLKKDMNHRYRRAADAAHALLRIPLPAGEETPSEAIDSKSPPAINATTLPTRIWADMETMRSTDTVVDTIPLDSPWWDNKTTQGQVKKTQDTVILSNGEQPRLPFERTALAKPSDAGAPANVRKQDSIRINASPPVPSTWHQSNQELDEHRWIGPGLELFAMREFPFVGREKERDALWQHLQDIQQENTVRAVVVHGAAGAGKSRIVEWFCRRAHEIGGATVLKTHHTQLYGADEGPAGMLTRYLRCRGLSHRAVLNRVKAELQNQYITDWAECHAVTELLVAVNAHDDDGNHSTVRLQSPKERHAVVRRFLERLSHERPVIVWLDDVHWSLESLDFVRSMLQSSVDEKARILLILTVQDEVLASTKAQSLLLDTILEDTLAAEMMLQPLSVSEQTHLVGKLLDLDEDLTYQIVSRTQGNPLFAMQLVSDWVRRGLLDRGEHGLRLKTGADTSLPKDVLETWSSRIDQLLRRLSKDDEVALEVAAVMGQEVVESIWQDICGRLAIQPSDSLLDTLFDHHLASREVDIDPTVWRFSHGMICETLKKRAHNAGRWQQIHRCCAETETTHPLWDVIERRGRHFMLAGEGSTALDYLMRSGRVHAEKGEFRQAFTVLKNCDKAISISPGKNDDRRDADVQLLRIRVLSGLRRSQEGEDLAMEVENTAQKHGWEFLRLEAMLLRARCIQGRGRNAECWAIYEENLLLAEKGGHQALAAEVRGWMGQHKNHAGDIEGASEYFLEAVNAYETMGKPSDGVRFRYGLACVEYELNNMSAARSHLQMAQQSYEARGDRAGIALCIHMLGEFERHDGDMEKAALRYEEAGEMFRAVGAGNETISWATLALVRILQEQYRPARNLLNRCLRQLERQDHQFMEAHVYACLTCCSGADANWAEWDTHFERTVTLLESTKYVEKDVAWSMTHAGDLARSKNQLDRAQKCYKVAINQWTSLQNDDEISAIHRVLAEIGGTAD